MVDIYNDAQNPYELIGLLNATLRIPTGFTGCWNITDKMGHPFLNKSRFSTVFLGFSVFLSCSSCYIDSIGVYRFSIVCYRFSIGVYRFSIGFYRFSIGFL